MLASCWHCLGTARHWSWVGWGLMVLHGAFVLVLYITWMVVIAVLFSFCSSVLGNNLYLNPGVLFCFQFFPSSHWRGVSRQLQGVELLLCCITAGSRELHIPMYPQCLPLIFVKRSTLNSRFTECEQWWNNADSTCLHRVPIQRQIADCFSEEYVSGLWLMRYLSFGFCWRNQSNQF